MCVSAGVQRKMNMYIDPSRALAMRQMCKIGGDFQTVRIPLKRPTLAELGWRDSKHLFPSSTLCQCLHHLSKLMNV